MTTRQAGLYIHLPWCKRKCPYCDFNSHVRTGGLPEQAYVDSVLADLDDELARDEPPLVSSLFIGGGTPSLFSGASINRLLSGIAARCTLVGGIEVTLEANPGSSEARRFAEYRAAGVTRLSLGIQSFNDQALAALGRVHDSRQARLALDAARAAGFDNFNLDIMFGLPGATPAATLDDLACALAADPAHLSWYQLTLEPGTAFARRPPALPSADSVDDAFDAGLAQLEASGYQRYEISAYARSGQECTHNLNYWHFGDYLGIGAGAHGKRRIEKQVVRREKILNPDRYIRNATEGTACAREYTVPESELTAEFMLNALRLKDGFKRSEFAERTGLKLTDPSFTRPIAEALDRAWLYDDGDQIRPTELGYRFLNDLQMLFIGNTPGAAP